MRVIIENVNTGAIGTWSAKVNPQKLIRLARPVRQEGRLNVILVSNPTYNNANLSLQFDLESATLLNLGNSEEAIIIDSREPAKEEPVRKQDKTVAVAETTSNQSRGDKRYLDELRRLPKVQREIGEQLLSEIRKEFPGSLVFHPKSGKFVESPDNFWVVRIQPRVRSLRIIVYGSPSIHEKYDSITLKPDMTSYSAFVVDSPNQIQDAVRVIKSAKRLKG